MATGYYKMAQKTKEEFYTDAQGVRWFKTGDIGQIEPTGRVVNVIFRSVMIKRKSVMRPESIINNTIMYVTAGWGLSDPVFFWFSNSIGISGEYTFVV